jgi:uncharacterized membrane protein
MPADPEEERRRAAREWKKVILELSTVAFVFPVATILGYFGGRLVGGWWEAADSGGLVGGLVGALAGFYDLYKVTRRMLP